MTGPKFSPIVRNQSASYICTVSRTESASMCPRIVPGIFRAVIRSISLHL